ncbi:hypothetical protein WZ211_0369 [Enterococcus faecalis]|nr:hypothetical protein WZ211_0369 [Enterococcus faecalis]OSH47289.1 hypothetical protein YM392_0328 [Enterococcus faecalis]
MVFLYVKRDIPQADASREGKKHLLTFPNLFKWFCHLLA